MTLQEYETAVYQAALKNLEGQPWFTGVCLDSIEASYRSDIPIDRAVEIVELDTEYWDAPIIVRT